MVMVMIMVMVMMMVMVTVARYFFKDSHLCPKS